MFTSFNRLKKKLAIHSSLDFMHKQFFYSTITEFEITDPRDLEAEYSNNIYVLDENGNSNQIFQN